MVKNVKPIFLYHIIDRLDDHTRFNLLNTLLVFCLLENIRSWKSKFLTNNLTQREGFESGENIDEKSRIGAIALNLSKTLSSIVQH